MAAWQWREASDSLSTLCEHVTIKTTRGCIPESDSALDSYGFLCTTFPESGAVLQAGARYKTRTLLLDSSPALSPTLTCCSRGYLSAAFRTYANRRTDCTPTPLLFLSLG